MNNIFSVVNPRLFSIFYSRDKESNYLLLMYIFDVFTHEQASPMISKDSLVESLTSYIRENNFSDLEDEDLELLESRTPREKALAKLNQFKKCGWIIDDISDEFDTKISLEGNIIPILETFKQVAEHGNQIEYTGYLYVISNILKHFDYSKSTILIEQIYENTRTLMGRLQGLNTKIKHYFDGVLKHSSVPELMSNITEKYAKEVLNIVFQNLRTSDNIDRYSSDISMHLDDLFDPRNRASLIRNYIETKKLNALDERDQKEAESVITEKLMYIDKAFRQYDDLIQSINQRNGNYLNSAKSRVAFLLNNSRDVDGIVIEALKAIKDVPEEDEIWEDVFSLYSVANVDCNSLYERAFNSKKERIYSPQEPPAVSKEDRERLRQIFLRAKRYSREEIRKYVLNQLGTKPKILSTDLRIDDEDAFIKRILVFIYSEDDYMPYTIMMKNSRTECFGYDMPVFEIIRK